MSVFNTEHFIGFGVGYPRQLLHVQWAKKFKELLIYSDYWPVPYFKFRWDKGNRQISLGAFK